MGNPTCPNGHEPAAWTDHLWGRCPTCGEEWEPDDDPDDDRHVGGRTDSTEEERMNDTTTTPTIPITKEPSVTDTSLAAKLLAELSQWVDEAPANAARDPEARTWGRLAKVAEEVGEVITAYIGMTGQNPRKGVTATESDVLEELFDVALTALCAHEHMTGNTGNSLDYFLGFVAARHMRVLGADRTAFPSRTPPA